MESNLLHTDVTALLVGMNTYPLLLQQKELEARSTSFKALVPSACFDVHVH